MAEDGRFMQLLRWEEQKHAFYYDVEIEKQAGAVWEGAVSGKTEASFLEVSLVPGIYRYQVRPYDLLERPGPASAWMQFEILPAKQPELVRLSPEAFYLDEDITWVLTLLGRNLVDGIDVSLRGPQGILIKPGMVTAEQSENEVRLIFRYEQLDTGDYTIHVTNPGGLTAEEQTFRIAYKKPVDINISAGYRPPLPLYGQIHELLETTFFPLGAYSRLSVIPFKRRWGYMGFEIEPSWYFFGAAQDDYTVQAQIPGAAIYGVYQRWLTNRVMALNFRIGGGIYSVLVYHLTFNRGKTEPMTVLIPVIAAGVSFQWLVRKPFLVEAGLDFTHFFTVDDPSPGYLRPFIGVGWRF
ncbi:MAG: hypothetical protein LBT87_00065 [Treponema sp.]|jgi:hypothetical protein|nr:hypothetical protein [Treponema sp.]